MSWLTDLLPKVTSTNKNEDSGGFLDTVQDVINSLVPTALDLIKNKADAKTAKSKKKLLDLQLQLAKAKQKLTQQSSLMSMPKSSETKAAATSSSTPEWLPWAAAAAGGLVLVSMLSNKSRR